MNADPETPCCEHFGTDRYSHDEGGCVLCDCPNGAVQWPPTSPVEAEDEGARPHNWRFAVKQTAWEAYAAGEDESNLDWALSQFEAAIRKEATAATRAHMQEAHDRTKVLLWDQVASREAIEVEAMNLKIALNEWRTRAEAAEGARDLQRHDLEQEHRERLLWMDATEAAKVAIETTVSKARVRTRDADSFPTSYEISAAGYEALHEAHHAIEAARALTAESVTPTGEPK